MTKPASSRPRISRADAERASILIAIGDVGCAHAEVASRLGLAATHAEGLRLPLTRMQAIGWIEATTLGVRVTDAGQRWVESLLDEHSRVA